MLKITQIGCLLNLYIKVNLGTQLRYRLTLIRYSLLINIVGSLTENSWVTGEHKKHCSHQSIFISSYYILAGKTFTLSVETVSINSGTGASIHDEIATPNKRT
jgi:hypothetical protein